MNSELILELRDKLDEFEAKGLFSSRQVFVFGANAPGDDGITWLEGKGIDVASVIDNNPANKGRCLLGVPICLPEERLLPFSDSNIVLIASSHYPEMKRQLERMGYLAGTHVFQLLNLCGDNEFTVSEEQFRKHADLIERASEVFDRFIEKYGQDAHVFVCPIKAIGDVYLAASYLRQYVESHGISHYVMTVTGPACEYAAGLFVEHVESVSLDTAEHLMRLSRFLGESRCRIKVLQPFSVFTSLSRSLQGVKEWTFADFYKYGVFGLGEKDRAQTPRFPVPPRDVPCREVESLCSKGCGVLLAPYAHSLPRLPESFWTALAAALSRAGFVVYTNVAGEGEFAVFGTKALDVPLTELVPVLEWMGCMISMRSGLCELVSSISCAKIVVYPEKACGMGRVLDVYSLWKMDGVRDVFEIAYHEEESLVIAEIVSHLKQHHVMISMVD